jgi:hypothetical protein
MVVGDGSRYRSGKLLGRSVRSTLIPRIYTSFSVFFPFKVGTAQALVDDLLSTIYWPTIQRESVDTGARVGLGCSQIV